jgi:hypothetical protein
MRIAIKFINSATTERQLDSMQVYRPVTSDGLYKGSKEGLFLKGLGNSGCNLLFTERVSEAHEA